MENDSRNPFARIVLPALGCKHATCANHPDTEGAGICVHCGNKFCGECLRWHAATRGLTCPACRGSGRTVKILTNIARLPRYPFFYVVVFVVIGAFSFVRNHGREKPAAILEREAKIVWFRRPSGVKYIHQAMQSRARARDLESRAYPEEAGRWYGLVAQALSQAEYYTAGSGRELDFAIGRAGAIGKSGDPRKGLALLADLRPEVEKTASLRLAYLSLRAELNWAAGNREKAVVDWREMLSRTQTAGGMYDVGGMIDDAVEKMAGGLFEAVVIAQLREACDTTPGKGFWRGRALDALTSRQIDARRFEKGETEANLPIPGMTMERFD